jgi:hypothetical protein
MASASVLGTSTKKGFSLGSAIGVGSMMRQNSSVVAMNVTPLIFSIRDSIAASENLELLSIEWNLDRVPGAGVLPEQLVVAGGRAGEVGCQVCVLCWEKGVVDPFKIDEHLKRLAGKLSDIELAVINNDLDYEEEGLEILRRYNDRLNSVIFVDMMDRQFQGSWDSVQIKSEQVDAELVQKMEVQDDFTTMPPGLKIEKRTGFEFKTPAGEGAALVEHFKHRILTPIGIETLARGVSELGRAVLSELNTYAFSLEEIEIAKATIKEFVKTLEKTEVEIQELEETKQKTEAFVEDMNKALTVIEQVLEEHIQSGKTLSIQGHGDALNQLLSMQSHQQSQSQRELSESLLEVAKDTLKKESTDDSEIRAWQLKSILRYYLAYSKGVAQYFASEVTQYLLVSSVRKAIASILDAFQFEMSAMSENPARMIITDKILSEIHIHLNAIFDKMAFEGSIYTSANQLMDSVSRDMLNVFKEIDVWDLIDFSDIADLSRDELVETNNPQLEPMLTSLEELVRDIVPDIAETLLSKELVNHLVEALKEGELSLIEHLRTRIESESEKSEAWRTEALSWIDELSPIVTGDLPLIDQLNAYLQFIHTQVGEGLEAEAIIEKVAFETEVRETAYAELLKEWETQSRKIEDENKQIAAHNQKREELIALANDAFEKERASYDAAQHLFKEGMSTTQPAPIEPLEPRLRRIETEYPPKVSKPIPPRPEQPADLVNYQLVRDVLQQKLEALNQQQIEIERDFTLRLQKLQSEGVSARGAVTVNVESDFEEYLLASSIRGLGRLLPRPTRVYLRNPEDPDTIYLVTYEFKGDELTMTVGDTFLRRGH